MSASTCNRWSTRFLCGMMVLAALSPLVELLPACEAPKRGPCVDQVWQTEGFSGARMSHCEVDQTGQLVGTTLLCTCIRADGGK